jgi:hypothetical protein
MSREKRSLLWRRPLRLLCGILYRKLDENSMAVL